MVIRRCISVQRLSDRKTGALRSLIAYAAAGLLAGCDAHPPEPRPSQTLPVGLTLAVPRHAQEADLLCWAACGQMVMEFWKSNVAQCAQVQRRYDRRDCCDNLGRSLCNTNGWPQFPEWGFGCRTSMTALTWSELQTQIVRSQVFVFSWMTVVRLSSRTVTGGHMMVATGYTNLENESFVMLNDPARSDLGSFTYEEYVAPTNYVHWRDIVDITKK
jgi:hypothetical protein